MTVDFTLIETLPALETLATRLSKEKALAFDIKADSFHHYLPKVCLIQVSTADETFIIDPLAVESVAPLKPLLEDPQIKKVLHGSDYDLRSLYRDYSIKTKNLFDTMIASQYLGEKELGLAALLKNNYGVILNKKYQKANWARRPLPQAMLLYAAHDTAYLIRLWQVLEQALQEIDRLSWVEEEFQLLIAECTRGNHESPPGHPLNKETDNPGNTLNEDTHLPLFRRFKGAGTMLPRDLAVLEHILEYREKRAMQQDRPPFKIFGNNVIKALVTEKPTTIAELKNMKEFPASFVPRYGKGILLAIKKGLRIPQRRLPSYPRTPRPPSVPGKQGRLKQLKEWRKNMAKKLNLDPGLVCNNAFLDGLAQTNPQSLKTLESVAGIKQWQVDVLGKEIVNTLRKN